MSRYAECEWPQILFLNIFELLQTSVRLLFEIDIWTAWDHPLQKLKALNPPQNKHLTTILRSATAKDSYPETHQLKYAYI